ncbi:MAG: HlyC/CorC family transporter [Spirochaetales bacterium]|nr:HlyC/CorC family transporter [Spirochaetales bacterium]
MNLVIILLCALGAAFFAGIETGLLSADQLALYLKREKGVAYARSADYLLLKPERLLATTLIGTNACVVSAAIVVASTLRERGMAESSWIGSLVLSLVLLIFTEVIPKSFFRRNADTVAVRLAPLLLGFHFALLPVSVILNTIVRLLLFSAPTRQKSKLPKSRDDLRTLVRLGSRVSGLQREEQRVFEEIFDFRGTLAREVMIQMHEYPVCPITGTLREAVRVSLEGRIRFLPVFRDRADNIVGYLDAERLLCRGGVEGQSIAGLLQKPVFYPDVKRVPDLLLEMNRRNLDVVFLSDEYGAVSGLITPAEIAAEIVGYIPGEPFVLEREIEVLEPGHFRVAGVTDIQDFYHETGIHLGSENSDTVGGFVCEQLGTIPALGATFVHDGYRYTVLDRDERHVKKLEIQRKGADAARKKTQ